MLLHISKSRPMLRWNCLLRVSKRWARSFCSLCVSLNSSHSTPSVCCMFSSLSTALAGNTVTSTSSTTNIFFIVIIIENVGAKILFSFKSPK